MPSIPRVTASLKIFSNGGKSRFAVVLLLGSACCVAQQHGAPSVTGSVDQGFAVPQSAKQPGEKDESARAIVDAYLHSIVKKPSDAFCAEGTMTMGVAPDTHAAHLALGSEKNEERLDFESPAGPVSVRFRGAVGGVVQPDGTRSRLPASAAAAGLFVTPDSLSNALKNQASSLQDDGAVDVRGTSYRRITYTTPLASSPSRSSLTPPLVVALLFDPATGQLVKTVDSVVLTPSARTGHLRVITFAEYRQTPSGYRPFEITESRDGQLLWRLSLQSVDATCEHSSDYYSLSGDQK